MIGGLVLAAGAGRRFGGPKVLVEVDGERWVDRAVRVLREGGAESIVVVVGAAPVEVPGADSVVANPDWAEGMGSSLRAGLAAAALEACSALVVLLVDQPGVEPAAVRRMIAAHEAGAELAVATYGGERGHPVLLGRSHWGAVAEAAVGDVGARAYLAAHAAEVRTVACDGAGDPADIDTREQLASRFPGAAQPGSERPWLSGSSAE